MLDNKITSESSIHCMKLNGFRLLHPQDVKTANIQALFMGSLLTL